MSSAQRREQLLDATKRIVDRAGFHAVSIEAVAREAGITRPIVYTHFKDLPGLLDALVDREGDRALEQIVLPRDLDEGDARASMVDAMRTYLRAAQADPARWRLVLMPPEGAPASLRERIAEGRRDIIAQLAEHVPQELASGRGGSDAELTAHMLSLLADENVRLHLADPERYPEDRLMAQTSWFLDRILGE
jgi:AcrR family transcriptional regulator